MSHKKFGPDRFSRLLDTNKQTDKQTNRQTDKPNLYIDGIESVPLIIYISLQLSWWCKPLIFQTLIIWSSWIYSLKYLRSTTLGCKDLGSWKSEFVAKDSIPLDHFWDVILWDNWSLNLCTWIPNQTVANDDINNCT